MWISTFKLQIRQYVIKEGQKSKEYFSPSKINAVWKWFSYGGTWRNSISRTAGHAQLQPSAWNIFVSILVSWDRERVGISCLKKYESESASLLQQLFSRVSRKCSLSREMRKHSIESASEMRLHAPLLHLQCNLDSLSTNTCWMR